MLINNAWSYKEPCGYCHFYKHRGYVSTANYKTHECGKKHCNHFEANPTHPFISDISHKEELRLEQVTKGKQLHKEYLQGTLSLKEYKKRKEKLKQQYDAKKKKVS